METPAKDRPLLTMMSSAVTTPTCTPPSSIAGRDRWERIRPILLIGSIVVPIACTIVAWTTEASTTAKIVGTVLAIAYVSWTVATNRRVMSDCGAELVHWPFTYLVVAYTLFAAMVLTNPVYFFIVILLYWYTFATIPLRWAIPAAIGLTSEMIVLQFVVADTSPSENPGVIISGAVSIAFGIVMAIWIGGIIDQSRQRATLIAELEATRAELAAAEHDAGALAERERLANEIHDTLAQGFTSIVMLSQAADAAVDEDVDAAHRHVRSIERTARENLAEARHLVEGMGPAALEDESLVDALQRLTERLSGDLGIDARTEVLGEARTLSSSTEVALMRAAQEAVANVRKHADATHVVLTLDFGPTSAVDLDAAEPVASPSVKLEVTDDGRGFDPGEVRDGYGLSGMRQRMARAGGDLEVTSAVGEGTTVKVRLT